MKFFNFFLLILFFICKASALDLTQEDQVFIKEHPVIQSGAPRAYSPIGFKEDDQFKGFCIDYLNLLTDKIGVNVKYIDNDLPKHVDNILSGQLHVLPIMTKNQNGENLMLFTEPYHVSREVIVVRKDYSVDGLEDFFGKKIAMLKGRTINKTIKANFPNIDIVLYPSSRDCVSAVTFNKADATIMDLVVASDLIQNAGYGNLKVGCEANLNNENSGMCEYRIAVSRHFPILHQLLQKAMNEVTPEEMAEIKNRWIPITTSTYSPKVELTAEEKAWIADNPKVRLGFDPAWPPFEWLDKNGKYTGISSDYAKLIESMTGLEIDVLQNYSWSDVVSGALHGNVDIIPALTKTPKRIKYLNFTQPYTSYDTVIAYRKGETPHADFNSYKNGKVGTAKGYVFHEFLNTHYPELELKLYKTPKQGLVALSNGDIDAYVGNSAVLRYVANENSLFGLEYSTEIEGATKNELAMGISKSKPELLSIINKVLKAIPEKTHAEIKEKWIFSVQIGLSTQLTQKEKEWIKEHPVIRMRVSDNPPNHFVQDGQPTGISVDIIQKIANQYGFEVEFVTHQTWQESLESIRNHETVDVLPTTVYSPERGEYMEFTKSYIKDPIVIFTHKDNTDIFSMQSLYDKTVVNVKGFYVEQQLTEKYPHVKQINVGTSDEAMKFVNSGKADAYIGYLTIGRYQMINEGLSNLKVAGPSTFEDHKFAFSIRDDWPVFATIINKGLASISPGIRAGLHYKYYQIDPNNRLVNYKLWIWIFCIMIAISFAVMLWNYSLRKTVAESTKEITKYSEHLEELVQQGTEELQKSSKRLRALFENMPNGFAEHEIILDETGKAIDYRYLDVNPAFTIQTGLSCDIIGKTVKEIIPDLEQCWIDTYADVALTGNPQTFEQYSEAFGKYFETHAFSAEKGRFAVLFEDITPRKNIEHKLEHANLLSNISLDLAGAGSWYMDFVNSPDRFFIAPKLAKIHGFANPETIEYVLVSELRNNAMATNKDAALKTFGLFDGAYQGELKDIDTTWQYTKESDGKVIWLRTLARIERDEDGTVTDIYGVTQDITEQKVQEDAIVQSQKQFQEMFDNAPIIMMLVAPDGCIQKINHTGSEIIGISQDKVIGMRAGDVFNCHTLDIGHNACGENRECTVCPIWNTVSRILKTQQSIYKQQVELTTTFNGETNKLYLLVSASLVKSVENPLVMLSIDDITAEKQAENDINLERERFKALFEKSSGAYSILDNTSFVDCNQATVELFGFKSKAEFVNTTPWELSSEYQPDGHESAKKAISYIEDAYKHGTIHFEWISRKKDGTLFPTEVFLTAMEIDNHVQLLTIIHDLTEIKRSQQAVRDSEQRLDMALHAASLGLWDWNLETNENFASDIWNSMLGYEAVETIKSRNKFVELVHPDDLKRVQQSMAEHHAGDSDHYQTELRLRCADGSYKWILSVGQVCEYDIDGKPTRMIGIHIDINETRILQDELTKAKEKAEADAHAKADFLANMSHEIRTPLNAVIGMSYLLSRTDLNEKQSEYLSKMYNSSNLLLETLNDILDFSKIEAGKIELENIEFSIEDLLHKIGDINSISVHEKGLELLYSCSEADIPVLIGDPTRVAQILNNLVSNAIKFTENGSVIIECKITEQDDKRAVVEFSVKDTGIGLSEERSKILFEAFTQADTSTTRQYGGTGLGLSISQSFVHMMNGEIWVESTLGVGSTFHFSIPFEIARNSNLTKRTITNLQNLRVFIIDNNPEVVDILKMMLSNYTNNIGFAKSGEEGMKALVNASDPYDLVLLDFVMPNLDGDAICSAIKESKELSIIPKVVMCTVCGSDEIDSTVPYDAYIQKPFTQSSLFDAISDAFQEIKPAIGFAVDNLSEIEKSVSGAHVLLVEDNVTNQNVAKEILELAGINVTIANNGKEAIEILTAEQFELVLMDIQMPIMDGYETTKTIRMNKQFENIPIIAMTANALESDRKRAFDAGMNDHISKPFIPKELFSTINDWVHIDKTPEFNESGEFDFPEIDGLDTKLGMEYTGFPDLYMQTIKGFIDTYENVTEKITSLLAEEAYEDAKRCAHSFKSIAGTIGALKLQNLAKSVEHNIADRKDINVVHQDLSAMKVLIEPLIKNIRKVMEEHPELLDEEV